MTNRWSPEPAPGGGLDPVLAETHVSLLIFAGDRAYKLKKDTRTSFLDFSSAEWRRQACEREVELNRRLAPDVYLGVAGILGPDGEPCDSLVVMRRMPPERRLARLARDGGCRTCLEAVAETIARFHRTAATGPEIDAEGSRDALLGRWEANIAQMEQFASQLADPSLPERIADLARDYLAGRKPLFDRRIAEGRIRDGHGDLLADDIFCLDDGPRILDCLEFDDRLRYVDVLDEACFLSMDLERIGGKDLGSRFLQAYRQASGEVHPDSLAHHYIAYRAHVRAKVASLRHEQGDPQALEEATNLLEIALRHLEVAKVVLVLVGGLPGTGKSTVARHIAEDHGWTVLRTDEVRKQIAGVPSPAPEAGGYRQGIYSDEMTAATYRTLLERARVLLQDGFSVILDASWSKARWRRMAWDFAQQCVSEFVVLRCEARFDVATDRIAKRARKGGDPSDATATTAQTMAEEFDPWPDAETIDTSGALQATLDSARLLLTTKLRTTGG